MTWFDVYGQIYFPMPITDALMLLMRWCCWCWCADAADADALMLLMHWCYWSNDAAVVDKMQICVWAHLKGIALSSEFRTVVQCLVALLLWFEIGIWPPPLPPLPDFSPEIKKSPQTNESRCDLSYVITQLKLSVLSLVQTTVGFGNLVSLSTKKSKLINDLQKSDCYSLNSERKNSEKFQVTLGMCPPTFGRFF